MKIKLLSWNIWWNGDFGKITDFLREADADVVGLQEVVSDDPSRNIIDYLKGLGYHCAFCPVMKIPDGRTEGNAVFSKFEIVRSQAHVLSKTGSRIAVQADIRAGEGITHVFSTHLIHTHLGQGDQERSALQILQGKNLLEVLPKKNTIAMGDFNAIPSNVLIQKMRAAMTDANPDGIPTIYEKFFDCETCNPKLLPNTTFDYIFTSTDLKTSGFAVEKTSGSDHLPISAIAEV